MSQRRSLLTLLAFNLFWVVYGSLYPFHFSSDRHQLFVWELPSGLSAARDIVINVGLYFPTGFLAFHVLPRPAHRAGKAIVVLLAGLLFSTLIEFLQAFDAGRVSSAIDICTNGAGALLGAAVASVLGFRLPSRCFSRNQSVPGVLLLITIAGHLFPFFPRVHISQYVAAAKGFETSFGPWNSLAWQTGFFCVQWLLVRRLLIVVPASKQGSWFAALLLLIPTGFLITGQSPSAGEVAGGVVALAV